ncbi:MAG: hypothetical protein ACJA0S_000195 [Rickettsiales bacterium]|jgi:hypothetical protein
MQFSSAVLVSRSNIFLAQIRTLLITTSIYSSAHLPILDLYKVE